MKGRIVAVSLGEMVAWYNQRRRHAMMHSPNLEILDHGDYCIRVRKWGAAEDG